MEPPNWFKATSKGLLSFQWGWRRRHLTFTGDVSSTDRIKYEEIPGNMLTDDLWWMINSPFIGQLSGLFPMIIIKSSSTHGWQLSRHLGFKLSIRQDPGKILLYALTQWLGLCHLALRKNRMVEGKYHGDKLSSKIFHGWGKISRERGRDRPS